jgi:hypothetical protein
MKRTLYLLPLLGLAPLGSFLGPYFDGAGIWQNGFLIGATSMFLLPWVISTLFLIIPRASRAIRISLFISTLLIQFILLFTVVPPGATCEIMGMAHRLRKEFSTDELRNCAGQLRQKFHDGTLVVNARNKDDHFFVKCSVVVVSDSELPNSLQGRFQRVFIQTPPFDGEQQVVFSLTSETGIICDDRKDVREYFVYSMADGVEAYRYERL